MSGYGSHLKILHCIFDHTPIKSVIEFGAGVNSTPFFLARAADVTSIETDRRWLDEACAASTTLKTVWHPYHVESDFDGFKYLIGKGKLVDQKFDLALVDGPYNTRRAVAQTFLCCRAAKIIVCHDAERTEYKYDSVVLPPGWIAIRTVHTGLLPWVLVLTDDPAWIQRLNDGLRGTDVEKLETYDDLSKLYYPARPAWTVEQEAKRAQP